MELTRNYSTELKTIIATSREIAIELGYEYISTIHFFLADCQLNHSGSIRSFVFETEDAFKAFFEEQRLGLLLIDIKGMPLTLEAENAIVGGFKLWRKNIYHAELVQPYHLFLAAVKQLDSLFYQLLEPKQNLVQRLENYYKKIGQIQELPMRQSRWNKFKAWVGR